MDRPVSSQVASPAGDFRQHDDRILFADVTLPSPVGVQIQRVISHRLAIHMRQMEEIDLPIGVVHHFNSSRLTKGHRNRTVKDAESVRRREELVFNRLKFKRLAEEIRQRSGHRGFLAAVPIDIND